MRLSLSSTTTVRTPCSPRMFARVRPTGPAPTMTMAGLAPVPVSALAPVPMSGLAPVPMSGLAPVMMSILSATSAPQQEVQMKPVERLRILVLWPVSTAGHDLESSAGDHRGDPATLGDVCGGVVTGPDDE